MAGVHFHHVIDALLRGWNGLRTDTELKSLRGRRLRKAHLQGRRPRGLQSNIFHPGDGGAGVCPEFNVLRNLPDVELSR